MSASRSASAPRSACCSTTRRSTSARLLRPDRGRHHRARDAPRQCAANDDRFEIVLDTFHDHRNAYHFVDQSARDAVRRAHHRRRTGHQHRVGRALVVERHHHATTGWTAEIRIPFTTLRSRPDTDTFGINFKRFIRRKNETAQWTGWDRDFNFLQVSQAGHLTGIEGSARG